MPTIKLQSEMGSHFTAVPHRFIDIYMPSANGEFVKVYLYLLRSLHWPSGDLSLSLLADKLFCTEKDVMRALGYWEQQDLLSVLRDSSGQPTGIVLQEIHTGTESHDPAGAMDNSPYRQAKTYGNDSHGQIQHDHGSGSSHRQMNPDSRKASGEDSLGSTASGRHAAPSAGQPASADTPPVPQFTRDKLDALKQDEDFSQLLFLTEMYLGKTLNSTEINSLCYYYDTLKFPTELIEYLVETCVSKGHKSFHYIEAVAQRWHSAGIRTVQEAKQQSSQYTRQYYSVLRAFGITDRSPIEQEIHIIDHWMNDFGFSTELICEACSRTIQSIGKASFSYADSILGNWHKQKVHNLKDLEAVDARHASTKPPKNGTGEKKASANNRFNNFSQREYDYRALEQQLLKKQ